MQVSLMPSSSMPVVTEVDASSPPTSSGSVGRFGQVIASLLSANASSEGEQSWVGQKTRAIGPGHEDSTVEATRSLARPGVAERFFSAAKPSTSKLANQRLRFPSRDLVESSGASSALRGATSKVPPSAKMKAPIGGDGSGGSSAAQSALTDNVLSLYPAVQPIAAVAMPATQQVDSSTTVTVAKAKQPALLPRRDAAQQEFSSAPLAFAPSVSDALSVEDSEAQVTAGKGEGTPGESDGPTGKGGGAFEPSAGISGLRSEIESGNLLAASLLPAKALQSPAGPPLAVAEPHSGAFDPQGNDSGSGKVSLSTTQISSVVARPMAHPSEISKSHESASSAFNNAPSERIQLQKSEGFTSPSGAESRPLSVAPNPSIPGSGLFVHREAVGVSNNPFTQLDAAPDLAGQQSHSTRHEVSVGYRDESYGWMEIRTQADGGRMSAVLQTSSTEAHRALSAEAHAIGQYLSDRDIALQTLSVHQEALESSAHSNAGAQSGHSSQPQTQSQSGSSASGSSRGTPLGSSDASEELVSSSLISVRV